MRNSLLALLVVILLALAALSPLLWQRLGQFQPDVGAEVYYADK